MKTIMKTTAISLALLSLGVAARASDVWKWPDGRRVLVVQPNEQINLDNLKSGVKGHAIDRRFRTNEAMYLANEIYLSGTEFFLRASENKLPIAHDEQFSYITNIEAYWYSRYNLMALSAHSRAGIGAIHGPYVDLKAEAATRLNEFGRKRGELPVSNKDVMLTQVAATYLRRTGLPRVFGSAVPLMLEFKSADPHLVSRQVNVENDDTGRAAYLNDFDHLSWSHDDMDHTIEMGGVGQSMLKKVLWAKFFLRRNHTDDDFPGQVFLGNNAADGFRGSMLTFEAVSTMLLAKASLFANPDKLSRNGLFKKAVPSLTGINPVTYRPENGLRYLPHEIGVDLIYMGDLPVRHTDFEVKNSASNLWDQAIWLWASSEFFNFANPRVKDNADQVFGYQTPTDGSVMEQKYALLAQGMANTVLRNIQAMHKVNGVLVDRWQPSKEANAMVDISSLSLAMVALGAYTKYIDLEPEKTAQADDLLRKQADFMLKVANTDGTYSQFYNANDNKSSGLRNSTSQAFAIRGLLAAYSATGEERYLDGARRTSETWNKYFWDEANWLYLNQPGDTRVVYTPKDVAAIISALREIILVEKNANLMERFKRFFVQALDVSGMMQSEDIFTGENINKVRAGDTDSDGDGIPFIGGGHGRHGIDSVFAYKVEFDLDSHHQNTTKNKPPVKTVPVSGEEIYTVNCAICHGIGGIGNEGPRLINNSFVQLTGKSGVRSTIANGRISVGMPSWGGVLSDDELDHVVDYIRNLKAEQ